MKQIGGKIYRQAQPACGCNGLHMCRQTRMAVRDGAPGTHRLGIGIHQQVQLRVCKAELNLPCPAVAKKLDWIFGGVWVALFGKVQSEAILRDSSKQAALVLKQSVKNRWLYPGSLSHSAGRNSIPAPCCEQGKRSLKDAFPVGRNGCVAQIDILLWHSRSFVSFSSHTSMLSRFQ